MKNFKLNEIIKKKITGNLIIFIASFILIYLIISIYFANHYFFNTVINGVKVSLKPHNKVDKLIKNYVKSYELELIERNSEVEKILSEEIMLEYNEGNSIVKIKEEQSSFKWITSLFKEKRYFVEDLFVYNKENLENKVLALNCLNKDIIEPKSVSFKYSNGVYEAVEEVYGNKIIKDKLISTIENSILKGERKIDLNENQCYENPKFTLKAEKTKEVLELLNKYVKARVTYIFGEDKELLDENLINQWLTVDENLEVVINERAVFQYVLSLSKKYDTVGIPRNFKTSLGKTLEVKDGFYGWKINTSAETKALIDNIVFGDALEKEPLYTQKGVTRGKDDIGNSYVEINITRQYLWFYKNGKLITQGPVVTGNPNRGRATKLGVYMLNYKEMGSTLRGPDYEAPVTYWMPFNGNIGIHDASWRYSFGGEIYKSNGSHGCINAPKYLAKAIYEKIEDGTPIICYEEEK